MALGFVGRDAAPAPPREAVGAPVDVGAATHRRPEPRGLRGRAPHAVGDGPAVRHAGQGVQHLASAGARRPDAAAAGVAAGGA